MSSTIAACVKNDKGDLLTYTVRGTKERCEEEAIDIWGKPMWESLQRHGAKIVQIQITEIEDGS